MTRIFLIVAFVLLAAGGLVLHRVSRPPSFAEIIQPLRDTLRELRSAVEACQSGLEQDAAGFQRYEQGMDSLRSRVRELEAIDPRGVPADSYQSYLEAFDGYNDSVSRWSQRTDTLRLRWARCRELTESHNTLADSLSRVLVRQLEEAERARDRR